MGLDDFMTVENAQLCVKVFSRYMMEKFAFEVADADIDVRRLVFKVMTQVHRHTADEVGPDGPVDLKRMNNLTLNAARDFYVQEYKLDSASVESVSLHRDRTTAGLQGRPLAAAPPAPIEPTPQDRHQAVLDYEAVLQERDAAAAATAATPSLPSALAAQRTKDAECEAPEVMMARVSSAERARRAEDESLLLTAARPPVVDASGDTLIAHVGERKAFPRYLSVNGFDRDWTKHRERFRFTLDLNSTLHRQIHSIGVTRLVVPMEISDERGIGNVPKQYYTHMFSFAFPYVVLNIEEFADVYEGSGDVSRRAFCQMVFESSYKAPSGRGYVVLKPMQDEQKFFYPTPLASLSRLTLALLRPNGALFNRSTDRVHVMSLEWEPINPTLLKVITTTYFDKNEIFKGDTLRFQGVTFLYDMVGLANTVNDVGGAVVGPIVKPYFYDQLAAFMNDPEGHEVIMIGQPNDSGFFRTFYIQAPGAFDEATGTYAVPNPFLGPTDPTYDVTTHTQYNQYSQSMMGAVAEWNDNRWTHVIATDAPVEWRTSIGAGSLINMSLQMAFTLKMMTTVDDAGILMSAPVMQD